MNDPLRLTPTPSYACPYCSAAFVSPNARRHHLNEVHSETPDTSGGAAAVAELHAVLAATAHSQTHKRLLQRRGEEQS
jgi:hypothetical protein